jgi:ADP-ribose pyrophosphatase
MSLPKNPLTERDYDIQKRDVLADGHYRYVRNSLRFELFNGGWSDVVNREVLEHAPVIGILPYDPFLDQIVLIEQFRIGAVGQPKTPNPWLVEIIAGCIEAHETPTEVAYREANEEAGCVIEALHPLCDYLVSPGCSNEYMYLFCGKINASTIGGIHGVADESEDIHAFSLSAEEAFTMLRTGQIKSAPAIIALQWLQLNREWLRSIWQK